VSYQHNSSKASADAELAAQAAKWMTQRIESYKRTCRSLFAIPKSDRAAWGRARRHQVAPGTADRCLVLTTHSFSVGRTKQPTPN
jgi:hypothetical protein